MSTLGSIYALKRRKWGLVLAGSIAEAIIVWPIGIVAIVMTILLRGDFTVEGRLKIDTST